jgi:hypothetical protein
MDPSLPIANLDLFQDVLRNFQPPSGQFDPSGHWSHTYHLYTVVNGDIPVPPVRGTLQIERVPQDGGGVVLNIHYEKTSRYAGVHTIVSKYTCGDDALATPLNWTSTYAAAPPAHPLKMSLEQQGSGMVSGAALIIRQGATKKTIPLPSAYTFNWALFDVVQRMKPGGDAALRFTLFDDDAPKPNQVLAFSQTADLKNRWPGAPDLCVHGFLQTGDGTTPQVYWLDDRGELLFLASGLNVFVLDSAVQAGPQKSGGRS